MSESVTSPEGKRRGCPFINLSKEYVPPYACMMTVAPPERRSLNDTIASKATGVKYFGYSINNEYGVYIDKCDFWGMLMQDASRFVFNGDVTVPPGGSGYCSFGEYPVRTELTPKMAPYNVDIWDGNYFAAVENSWRVYAVASRQAAFRYYGKTRERSLMLWLAPNYNVPRYFGIGGAFQSSGIAVAELKELTQLYLTDYFTQYFFSLPDSTDWFSTPITLKAPGVYIFEYEGFANALNPAEDDTAIAFQLELSDDTGSANLEESKGGGVLYKMSNGYSGFWPSQSFRGYAVVRVESKPVKIQLRQTMTEKVTTEGRWRCTYDKGASLSFLHSGSLGLSGYWWWWGQPIL